jgi:hypothetical protein
MKTWKAPGRGDVTEPVPGTAGKEDVMTDGSRGTTIAAWEDDPVAAVLENQPPLNQPVQRPEPDFDPPGLPVRIAGPPPAPPDVYKVGTEGFRYWTLADALARAAGFWSRCVPAGTTWQPDNGTHLMAVADEGVDLNAYYDRNGLHFFHDSVRGKTVYSGESPDVVCHELGHAVLDSVKPQLWDAASIEVAAFHESFADCSAILSNLRLPSLRDDVLRETGGLVAMASRLSRLAEDLGWAIRQLIPDAVSADCLRSAVNSFYYRAPASLPPRAPATSLSSEPHNFSRVFTAGFFRMLGSMFNRQPRQDSDGLLKAAEDAGKLLIEGVHRSPVVPAFYAQVAAHMVAADAELFNGKYRGAIRNGFVSAGVLSVHSAAGLGSEEQFATVSALTEQLTEEQDGAPLPRLPLTGTSYGLPSDLFVRAASQPRRFSVASGMPDTGDTPSPAPDNAASSFVEDLVRRGRIAAREEEVGDAPIIPTPYTTHEIRPTDGALELRRTRFDCGFGLH